MSDLPTTYDSLQEWQNKAKELFGEDSRKWAFVCPVCKHVATAQEWADAGAPEGSIAFSCIGRWPAEGVKTRDAIEGDGDGPCNYAGGGLFQLNPVIVKLEDGQTHKVFQFAVTT